MSEYTLIEKKIREMIDDLKAAMQDQGLLNSSSESEIMTSIFLYKFLNDKYMYNIKEFAKKINKTVKEVEENNTLMTAFYQSNAKSVAFGKEDTIESLINKINDKDFYKFFDQALKNINDNPRNDIFKIETSGGTKLNLFNPISNKIPDGKDKNNFAQTIFGIISQDKINFSDVFKQKFDFFAKIFEYLIKDYNKDSGDYAEYFTPQSCARIMSKILVYDEEHNEGVEIYDPSAGSGTLIMHLSHELGKEDGINKSMIYTQDISQKSTDFLRINLLLNGLTECLHNFVKGDTLKEPVHFQREHDENSGLKRFDYIVSHPPFKTDFSNTRDTIESKFKDTDRFFAGIPKVPAKDKKKMSIYLMFLQHILYSLKETGRAAIVVPTGFLTETNGISKKIRKKMIEEGWLRGVVSMPSNIFATTGTNVSIIFIDKSLSNEDIILVDASNYGKKIKDGKNQKTILSFDEELEIINIFNNKKQLKDISVLVSGSEIKSKNHSFSASQYFDIEIEYEELSPEEFKSKILNYKKDIRAYFSKSKQLESEIEESLKRIKI
ncbi:MAG: class I SAM-dependent DNA methyltransferase [Bacteroidales bacterium]|nr:class I SAM-dependent DNA methyltransferase [Bacteroidales bacterium]